MSKGVGVGKILDGAEGPPHISAIVERIGFGLGQIRVLVLSGGVWLADGAELLIIGSVTKAVNKEWNLDPWQRGAIVSTVFLGVMAGNMLSGKLGDSAGRRFPIVLSYLGVTVFSTSSVFAWSYWPMVAVRLLVGVAFGVGQPSCQAFSGEIVPAARRIHMLALSQCLFCAGEFYSAMLIWISDADMKNLDWRWLVCMGAVPSAVLGLLAFFFLVESPTWLAMKGRQEEARKTLEDLRDANGAGDFEVNFRPVHAPTAETENSGPFSKSRLAVVFDPRLRFCTLVTCMCTFTVNFLFYGGLYAFPQVLPDMDLPVSPAANLMIAAAMEVPGYGLGVVCGVYFTRKNALLGYLGGVAMSTLIFVAAAVPLLRHDHLGMAQTAWVEAALQVGLAGHKIFTSVGFLISYLYAIEIYPTVARATGTAVCLSFGRLGAILCPLVYEMMKEMFRSPLPFFGLLLVLSALNFALVACLSKETKDARLEDHLGEAAPLLSH